MDLILWRHAEAFELREHSEIGSDLERALTPRGERQAHRVAAWLGRQLPHGAKVLASPARRAQQTAAALERKVKTVDALAPGRGVDELLAAARWPTAREAVLVVGHQPTLGQAASRLLCGMEQPWSVRKGGLWWLRGRERDGALQVVLHAVMSPELA
jgi:phosphohistidine phosphatase